MSGVLPPRRRAEAYSICELSNILERYMNPGPLLDAKREVDRCDGQGVELRFILSLSGVRVAWDTL